MLRNGSVLAEVRQHDSDSICHSPTSSLTLETPITQIDRAISREELFRAELRVPLMQPALQSERGNFMGESTNVLPRIEETDAEIELSAQELLDLAELPQVEERESKPVLQPSTPAKSASAPKLRRSLSLVAAVSIVGAIYVLASSVGTNRSATNASQRLAQAELPAPAPVAEHETVRFANPFDAAEVFEFPAGTTETQARDAVAEVLLTRAMSRQKT
jgi:hypothetical protein